MKKKMKRFLGILLSLALVFSLMPGMSLTAYAAGAYDQYVVTGHEEELGDKVVNFNGIPWYIIKDNSTAVNEGTVTLLAQGTIGKNMFDSQNNSYSNSSVKSFLDSLTNYNYAYNNFKDVADAIVGTDLNDVSVTGAKLYLLSTEEANNLPESVRKLNTNETWWLRTY